MPVSRDFHRFVIEQLDGLGGVTSRSMFGGIGLYHDGLFFGLIDDDTLYLKVDGTNRDAYVRRGMKPFCPYPDKPEYQMGGYYQVPVDVLEDAAQLEVWARQSRQVALGAQAKKGKRKGKPKTTPKPSAKARPKARPKAKRTSTKHPAASRHEAGARGRRAKR